MKKLISLLLTLVLLCTAMTLFSLTASAAEPDTNKYVVLEHVYYIDEHRMVLEFSEDVVLTDFYIAIRHCTVDATGRMSLAWNGDTPLQYEPGIVELVNGNTALLSFAKSIPELLDCAPYTAYLAIEELYPTKTEHTTVEGIYASANHSRLLYANRQETGSNWDGVYVIPEKNYSYVLERDESLNTEYSEDETLIAIESVKETKGFPEPVPYTEPVTEGETQTEETKSGCGSVVGIAALALLVLAAPAVCRKH